MQGHHRPPEAMLSLEPVPIDQMDSIAPRQAKNNDYGVYVATVGQVAKAGMFKLAEVELELGSRASPDICSN